MNAKAKLQQLEACADAIYWIGDRTIEQAWRECRRVDWMLWLLRQIAPNDQRCRLAAADFAERVWHLIDNEPTRLAAAWAVGAARRGDADEMMAAAFAANAAYAAAAFAANAANAAAAASAAANAAAAARSFTSRTAESAAQADILRQYFSAREVGDLFRQAPA